MRWYCDVSGCDEVATAKWWRNYDGKGRSGYFCGAHEPAALLAGGEG